MAALRVIDRLLNAALFQLSRLRVNFALSR
jgi:hypothetical protein